MCKTLLSVYIKYNSPQPQPCPLCLWLNLKLISQAGMLSLLVSISAKVNIQMEKAVKLLWDI